MIAAIIRWSIHQRFFVLLTSFILVGAGLFSLKQTPVDAIPDLSDVQVIIKTSYPGQAPQVVEDQVTYPLTSAMLSVPGAVTVGDRGGTLVTGGGACRCLRCERGSTRRSRWPRTMGTAAAVDAGRC
mgnify:CR=1 FL=1